MTILKIRNILALLLICNSVIICGQITINQSGKISDFKRANTTQTSIDAQLSSFSTKADDVKSFEKTLSNNFKEAKKLIEKPDYDAFLKRYLSNYSAFKLNIETPDFKTNTVLIKMNSITNQFKYDPSSRIITKINLLNSGYLSAYNDLYEQKFVLGDKRILNEEELKKIRTTLLKYNDTIVKFKERVEASNVFFDIELYAQIEKYNVYFDNIFKDVNSDFGKIKTVLSSDWVKSWIWVRKGKLTLNPYDLQSSDFYSAHPEYDVQKARLYDEFIRNVIKNIIDSAKFKDMSDFKNALNEMDKGKKVYSEASKDAAAESKYNSQLQTLTTTTIVLNQLSNDLLNPKDDIFYLDADADPDNTKSFLENPARIDEDKDRTILIYNASVNDKFIISSKSEVIADKSRFQIALDSIVNRTTQLASLIAGFTPFNSVISTIRVKNNGNGGLEAYVRKSALDTLTEYYSKAGLSAPAPGTSTITARKKIAEIKAAHIKKLQEHIFDSQNLQEIFFTYATIPTGTLTGNATTPSYTTTTLKVKIPDKPTLNQIKVNRITKGNDTINIKSFQYRAGRLYRFQVSAGVLYTAFSNRAQFRQTTVTKGASGIEITNDAQPFNFFVALHTYIGKGLFIQDDKICGAHWDSRFAFVTGLGISKNPLDNFYLGLSYDFVPGLKLNVLCKLYRNDDVIIRNDEIIDRYMRYKPAFSMGVSIDPFSLTKTLTNLKK